MTVDISSGLYYDKSAEQWLYSDRLFFDRASCCWRPHDGAEPTQRVGQPAVCNEREALAYGEVLHEHVVT